jgi:hypothetical protein
LREGNHFDQSLGGVAGLFENIRSNTQGISNYEVETGKNLKGSVLPIFERLHTEIKNKVKELDKGAANGAKTVDKHRNTTQKHIELLGQHSAQFESSGGIVDAKNDPYVLQKGVYHRLNRQIIEENNNNQDIIVVQNNFAAFEAHVIEVIQQGLEMFLQFSAGNADNTKALYANVLETAQAIPGDMEWNKFVARSGKDLVDPSAPPKALETTSFPNQNHAATKAIIEGTLERKGKIMKSYDTGYYAITPSGFLHEYKDNDNLRKDPVPEMSLYLPDCTIGGVSGQKFNVKGKDSSKGKVGGTFSSTHEYAFKAHSDSDAIKWHEILVTASGQAQSGAYTSAPTSPIVSNEQRTVSGQTGPPAYSPSQETANPMVAVNTASGEGTGTPTKVFSGEETAPVTVHQQPQQPTSLNTAVQPSVTGKGAVTSPTTLNSANTISSAGTSSSNTLASPVSPATEATKKGSISRMFSRKN